VNEICGDEIIISELDEIDSDITVIGSDHRTVMNI
jgi:hypothetical protein